MELERRVQEENFACILSYGSVKATKWDGVIISNKMTIENSLLYNTESCQHRYFLVFISHQTPPPPQNKSPVMSTLAKQYQNDWPVINHGSPSLSRLDLWFSSKRLYHASTQLWFLSSWSLEVENVTMTTSALPFGVLGGQSWGGIAQPICLTWLEWSWDKNWK